MTAIKRIASTAVLITLWTPTQVRTGAAPGGANPTGAPAPITTPLPSKDGGLIAGGSFTLFAGVCRGSASGTSGTLATLDTSFVGTAVSSPTTSGINAVTATLDGKLWVLTRAGFGAPQNLLEIDPVSGAVLSSVALSGSYGGRVCDLAVQPGSGTMYATGSGTLGDIYTLDPTTGVMTFVGNCGVVTGGISFTPGGTMYATSAQVATPLLAVVDPATGLALSTISYGPDVGVHATAVRPSDGTLLGLQGQNIGGDAIISIDPATGATANLGASGIGTMGGFDYLEFSPAPDGSLFAGVCRGSATGTPGTIATLDAGTFVGTPLSNPTSDGINAITATLDGKLWAVTRAGFGAPQNLLEIDPVSGATLSSVALGGSFGGRVCDLAVQPGSGTMYATGSGALGDIYTLDVTTGVMTFVGNCGVVTGGISFTAGGTLYATSAQVASPFLAVVDPATGLALSTITYGPDVGVHATTVRPSDGTLLGLQGQFAGGDAIISIDPATGATANLGAAGIGTMGGFTYLDTSCPPGAAVAGVARAGLGVNPGTLSTVGSGKLVIDTTATVLFAPPSPTTTTFSAWGISLAPCTGSCFPVWGGQELLISVSLGNRAGVCSGPFVAGITETVSCPVPNICALVGVAVFTQGINVDPSGFQLTNALDYTIGAF